MIYNSKSVVKREKYMGKRSILIVEDEKGIQDLVCHTLEKEGFNVNCASSSTEALQGFITGNTDLVILDLMLPDIDGLNLCKILKSNSQTESIPVIMLTAKNSDADIIKGFSLGADDYITKPFNLDILVHRIKAVLRRKKKSYINKPDVLQVQDLKIYSDRNQVSVNKTYIDLTHKEFQTLYLLASNPGRVFTRDQISDFLNGIDNFILERSVDALILRLRRKLNQEKDYIETVWGVGYRIKE